MEEDWIPEAREAPHLPIINQIEREDWNGAKKAVQKKLQKSTDTIYPALLTFIQAHQGLANERAEALVRILKLADEKDEAKERITNIDDLEIYEHAAKQLAKGGDGDAHELSDAIGNIRWLAVQKIPTDENFATACLKKCMTESNFDAALRIAMSMGKNFPKNRKYLFYQPLIRLLLSQAPHLDAHQRSINLKVATGTLQKCAKATTEAKGTTLPAHSLRDRQEILLFHRALKMSGHDEDLIAALLNPKIGVNSDIIKGDWSVVKSLVDALHTSRAPDSAKKTIDLCVGLLEKACANEEGKIVEPMYGDWAVWNAYIDAIMVATEGGTRTPSLMEKFFEINDKHRFSKPPISKTNQRNARLASVKFMVLLNPRRNRDTWTFKAYEHDQLSSILHEIELKEGGNSKELRKLTPYVVRNMPRRLLTIIEYLHEYGHVTAAFTDIKPYFELLGNNEREQLLGIAAFVMVDRRGWSCVEGGQDIKSPESVNFPPKVNVPDQVTAVINHFKFSYLSSDMPDVFDSDSDEKDEMSKTYYALCSKCKVIGVKEDGSVSKIWSKRRGLCCEHCLRAVILYGMTTYDHAINGWAEKAWSPFATNKTDMHPGDDAVIMVAMALIKLGSHWEKIIENFATENDEATRSFSTRHGNRRLIQAAAILEFAHSKSPANPQLLLLLVRLYLLLGAGSLAMRAYSRLNLKQVQGETLGYVLLDRISMIHPHPCDDIMTGDEPVPFDPATELAKIHQRYRAFKTQISRNYMTCLQTGSYDSIFQLINVQEKLSPSLACTMSVVELRKVIRIRNPDTLFTKSSHGYDILTKGVINNALPDNIDYQSFPSFDHSPPRGEHHAFIHEFLAPGPKPTDERTRGDLLIDELMMVIRAPFNSSADMTRLLQDLKQHDSAFYKTALWDSSTLIKNDPLTEYENRYLFNACNLIRMVLSVGYHGKRSSGVDGQLRDQDLAHLRLTLESMKARVQYVRGIFIGIPSARLALQPLYSIYETVQMVMGVDKLLQHPSFQKNPKTVERYQSFVNEPVRGILEELKKTADHIKNNMDQGGRIDDVLWMINEFPNPENDHFSEEVIDDDYTKATIGKGLRRILTPEFTEVFASELVASWDESILGLQCLL